MGDENIIISYERRGREKMRRLCEMRNLDYYDNPTITEPYDGTVVYNGKSYLIEIKDRDASYNDYPTVLMESAKKDALLDTMQELEADGAYYVSFYGDTAWVFDVTSSEVLSTPSTTIRCNKHTAFGDGKREKEIILLPKAIGHKYNITE